MPPNVPRVWSACSYWAAIAARPPRSTYFWILPVAVFGSSATNVKARGTLKCASCSRANARSSSSVADAPGLQDDEGVRRFAPAFVRHADDGGLLHRGMPQQHALDFDRRDVLAAADDHVLEPIADLDVAVGMDDGGVAAVEPAAAHRRGRRLRVVVVALHDDVAADDDLAERRAVVRHFAARPRRRPAARRT